MFVPLHVLLQPALVNLDLKREYLMFPVKQDLSLLMGTAFKPTDTESRVYFINSNIIKMFAIIITYVYYESDV
ncbi:hypothetical protein GWI33_008765 [Rhynchophorus ferrugineus]|uniref:Uncharacterized protein n=1 Tax=Rhynchophorus ferrugineus TaxID=354439 RepID=A0A834IEA7_RHYFE|nr:hypothetical protein GWI33_008765 [Rhynchophorus ferrugineus]